MNIPNSMSNQVLCQSEATNENRVGGSNDSVLHSILLFIWTKYIV
jgi:hypothetical protein